MITLKGNHCPSDRYNHSRMDTWSDKILHNHKEIEKLTINIVLKCNNICYFRQVSVDWIFSARKNPWKWLQFLRKFSILFPWHVEGMNPDPGLLGVSGWMADDGQSPHCLPLATAQTHRAAPTSRWVNGHWHDIDYGGSCVMMNCASFDTRLQHLAQRFIRAGVAQHTSSATKRPACYFDCTALSQASVLAMTCLEIVTR